MDFSSPEAEITPNQELISFIPEQLTQKLALEIYVSTGFDTDLLQLTLQNTADSIDLSRRQVPHERHDGLPVIQQNVLSVGLVHIGTYFGELRVSSYSGGDGDVGLVVNLIPHLLDSTLGRDIVLSAVPGDIEISLVYTGAFEARVVVSEDLADFLGLGSVLVEVERDEQQLGTQLLGDKTGHTAPTAKFAGNIVAGGQNTAPDGEGDVFEFGAVELFDSGVEGIAVDVDDMLGEVPRGIKLLDKLVGGAELAGQVELFEATFLLDNLMNLLCQDLVLFLFPVEELRAFGGIVDDLRYLKVKKKA